jgi:hypothetical protein
MCDGRRIGDELLYPGASPRSNRWSSCLARARGRPTRRRVVVNNFATSCALANGPAQPVGVRHAAHRRLRDLRRLRELLDGAATDSPSVWSWRMISSVQPSVNRSTRSGPCSA